MNKCSCGLDSHMDQIKNYPVGAKVIFSDHVNGKVVDHCADGRALILVDGVTHTFHHIESFVDRVELPGQTVGELQAEIARLKAATIIDNDDEMIEHLRDMGYKVITPEEMAALRKGGECPVCGFAGRPR
jgi:hypothetical protein